MAYGKVKASNGEVSLVNDMYEVKLETPIEYLKLLGCGFDSLLYLNDNTNGIYLKDFRCTGTGGCFETKNITIWKFKIVRINIDPLIEPAKVLFKFSWYGFY